MDARVPLRPSPGRLADQRLWRIDPTANYGPLNGLARNRINTALIAARRPWKTSRARLLRLWPRLS
jgi:hypothetical protein